jgi:inorganic pyrophosphatase
MAARFKGAVFDIDGVLEYQGRACHGARETIDRLREKGVVLRFLTNSTMKSRTSCARRLGQRGIGIEPREIVTASYAAACFLRAVNARSCLVMVDGEGKDEFSELAFDRDRPEYLVVGDNRSRFDFEHLNEAVRILLDGAKLVGMQSELLDTSFGDVELNVGSWVGMLERASGVPATYVGKPSEFAFQLVLDTMGLAKRDVVMVGDKVPTDVRGAKDFGMACALLRTGEFDEHELAVGPKPDFIFDSLTEVLRLFDGKGP